jgi:hypothetical protein
MNYFALYMSIIAGVYMAILNCSQLGSVFALDTDNAFDQMIPLMQSIRDGQKPKKEGRP